MRININDLPPWAQRQAAQKILEQERRKKERGGNTETQKHTKNKPPDASDHAEGKPQNKYRNEPTVRITESGNTIRFPSQKEARRYDELMVMLKAGQIRDLRLQQEYTLQGAYTTPDGIRVRAIKYNADFYYENRVLRLYQEDGGVSMEEVEEWDKVVEDVKGGKATKTRVYAIKKKLLQERFGITVKET